jgi:hypothetical protein
MAVVPKRDDQRVRTNAPLIPTTTIDMSADGEVEVPALDIAHPHPIVSDFYESLKTSGQSKYYEPSDWQHARIVCHFLSKQLWEGKPSGQMLATIHSMMTEMMVSEGARRRLRMEIAREQKAGELFDASEVFRAQLEKNKAA